MINYELFIRDCDEHGIPKVEKCGRCKRLVPSLRINLHTRSCKNKNNNSKERRKNA